MKEKILKIFNQLNLVDKAKGGTLTSEDWSLVDSSFNEAYGVSMEDAIVQTAERNNSQVNEFNAQISTLLNGVEGVEAPKNNDFSSVMTAIGSLVSRVAELQSKPEADVPLSVVAAQPDFGKLTHTTNHAFGVDDAMFKAEFDSYKELERMYLGYLNKEGSSPIKWSFIEWCIVHISQQLAKEQAIRKVWGCFVKPEKDKPGHEMNAGNGVLYTLLRYYHENKLLPIDGDYLVDGVVNGALMFDLINDTYKKASERVDDISEYQFFLNTNHRKVFSEYLRDTYGRNVDFTTNTSTLLDTNITINWVPYLFNYPLILLQRKGNIQCLENLPGEMLNIRFHSDLEGVIAMSFWKEGMSATYVGKQYATLTELINNDMEEQDVFVNLPSMPVAVDATTIKAEKHRFFFKTGVNTATKVLTDITGAAQGVVYCIQTGGANPQKITKVGKFATIISDYTPVLEGDYIMVVLNSDETSFLELERRVNGVRSINKLLQPNLPS